MSESFQKNTESEEADMIRRNLEAISKEMYKSKVKKIEKNIQRMKDMQYIFNQNYDELINHIDKFQNDEFVNKLDNNILRLEIHLKTIRYLFNYLSSAVSIYDHICKLINKDNTKKNKKSKSKKYKQNKFEKKADEILEQKIPADYNRFIKKIRNHLIHEDIIKAVLETDMENVINDSPKKVMVLDLTDKRYYKKFWKNKKIAKYIIHYFSIIGLDIKKFSCDYNNKINNYLDWFFQAFIEFHKPDYEYYHQLETESINLSAEYSKLISE